MILPKPYFTGIPQFGDLTLDGIFLYVDMPILFTCIDCKKDLFICVCRNMDDEQRWLVAPTSIDRIEQLISKSITMRSIFNDAEGYGCIVSWQRGQRHESYTVLSCSDFHDEDLPKSGKFFESRKGDFDSYIKMLYDRKNHLDQIDIRISQCNFPTEVWIDFVKTTSVSTNSLIDISNSNLYYSVANMSSNRIYDDYIQRILPDSFPNITVAAKIDYEIAGPQIEATRSTSNDVVDSLQKAA